MSNGNGADTIRFSRNDLARLTIAALIGAFLTGVGGYVSLGRDVVTKAELSQLLNDYSPYSRDKALIQSQLEGLSQTGEANQHTIEQLAFEVAELKQETKILQTEIQRHVGGR